MGGAVSAGDDNDDLIDNLAESGYIKLARVEDIFRVVDRGNYIIPNQNKTEAFRDTPWRKGHLHLSAPCIYSEVMQGLQLESGMSFLNIGSGTGYLSTMAGLVLGAGGSNHGVELYQDCVDHSYKCLSEFRQNLKPGFDEFEFCEPVFVVGNALKICSNGRQYDRIYCGAGVLPRFQDFFKNLVKIGGIIIMPLMEQLVKFTRISEERFEEKNLLPVSFALLALSAQSADLDDADEDDILGFGHGRTDQEPKGDIVYLPPFSVYSLKELSRFAIRRVVRGCMQEMYPNRLEEEKARVKAVRMYRRMKERGLKGGKNDGGGGRRKRDASDGEMDDFIGSYGEGGGSSDSSDDNNDPYGNHRIMNVLQLGQNVVVIGRLPSSSSSNHTNNRHGHGRSSDSGSPNPPPPPAPMDDPPSLSSDTDEEDNKNEEDSTGNNPRATTSSSQNVEERPGVDEKEEEPMLVEPSSSLEPKASSSNSDESKSKKRKKLLKLSKEFFKRKIGGKKKQNGSESNDSKTEAIDDPVGEEGKDGDVVEEEDIDVEPPASEPQYYMTEIVKLLPLPKILQEYVVYHRECGLLN